MSYSKIVVTGGSGMLGKALQQIMPNAIYLSSNEYNLTREQEVINMYYEHKPTCVIHLAAKVSGIQANIAQPLTHYEDNVLMNTLLLKYAREFKVPQFVAILSTCIYPDVVANYPLTENMLHLGPPTPTNFSYGYAKRSMAVQIDACNKQYGTNYSYLIPCNIFGEHEKSGTAAHFLGALLHKMAYAIKHNEKSIYLLGTGKPLRQFVYAGDVAAIIKEVVEKNITTNMNIAPKETYSIAQLALLTMNACDMMDNYVIQFDKNDLLDGQFRKDCSNELLMQTLPYFKFTPFKEAIQKTFLQVLSEYEKR